MENTSMKKCAWLNTDNGLLILRIGMGLLFIATGYMKAADMGATVGFFATLGFSAFWAYLVTAVELLGGIAVLLGICTRCAAALLTITMIVASYILRHDFTMMMTPLITLFAVLSLTFSGGGKWVVWKGKKMEISN